METIEKAIEVAAPLSRVYKQWTQFQDFPKFMEGVAQVRPIDDKHLHWVARIGGKQKEWDAEIVEQVPEQRIGWRSTTGTVNSGTVQFQARDGSHTVITLRMQYEPESALERLGDSMGLVAKRVEGDLKRFRDLMQQQGTGTGARRGGTGAGNIDPRPGYGTSGRSGI